MAITIDRISFQNYRQYGTGYLSFHTSDQGKLSVLVAQNGTGKTTLLNAITWCLYEEEPFLADEDKALPVVTSAVVKATNIKGRIPVSVTVRIFDDTKIVELKRSVNCMVNKGADGNKKVTAGHPLLEVAITDSDTFSNTIVKNGTDAEIIVKQYFDYEIYKYYFFDGEKLRDFFSASQSNSIQQSIFNISQVTMLDKACSRLSTMHKENTKTLAKDAPDIAALNSEQDKQEKKRAIAEESLVANQKEIDELSKKLKENEEILRSYAPVQALQNERTQLEEKLDALDGEEKAHRIQKASFIRKYMVLLTLYPRIKKTLDLITEKESSGDLPPAIDKDLIRKLLQTPSCNCPICNNKIDDTAVAHLNELLRQFSVSSATSNYLKEIKSSLEIYIDEVTDFKKKLDDIRQFEIDFDARKEHVTKRIKEIGASLSSFDSTGEKIDVAKVEGERASITRQINIANQAIGAAELTIQNCDERLAQIAKDRKAALKKMNEHSDIRKQLAVVEMLHTHFKQIKSNIMDEMKKEIEDTTWKFFSTMIWKKKTFGGVNISDRYDVSVYDKSHTEMTGSLSATEQMALAYAFTLAIHQASGKNCPLVIDSPLGRVSDTNRENMAAALKDVSKDKQIIMLFTPDEFSESVRKIYSNYAEIIELKLSEDEAFVEGIER